MTPEREKYLRQHCHTGQETHFMEFKLCPYCALGEAFAEIEALREDNRLTQRLCAESLDELRTEKFP